MEEGGIPTTLLNVKDYDPEESLLEDVIFCLDGYYLIVNNFPIP